MDPLENPYRPGAGTTPPAMLGRDELIDAFGVTIRRALDGRPGKSYIPIGLRGVGKTVLLNRFTEIAADEGMHVAYIEAPETGDFRSLLAARLRKALLQLNASGPAKRLITRALGVLRSFTFHLPDGGAVSISVDPIPGEADSGMLSEDLTDLLVAVGQAVAADRTGLLVAIDEVQYLSALELGALIAAIHRTNQLDLPVVVVGAGLPQLPGLAGQAKSYAERLFDFPILGTLSDDDAAAVLAIPANALDVDYQPEALALLVELAHGYPYFLQEWGYHVWNAAPRSPITRDDVLAVERSVMDQLDRNFFLVRLDRLTPKEREYLHAMADLGPGPHRSGDIAARLGVRVEAVAPRRAGLIAKGMIYSPAHGDTAFSVPLFDDFLRRVGAGGNAAEAATSRSRLIGRQPGTGHP